MIRVTALTVPYISPSSHQVELTPQGKMCDGMIESISKACRAHTSATKLPVLLLLVQAMVSTGQGLGKSQYLCLYTMFMLLCVLLSAEDTLSHHLCHDSETMNVRVNCPWTASSVSSYTSVSRHFYHQLQYITNEMDPLLPAMIMLLLVASVIFLLA